MLGAICGDIYGSTFESKVDLPDEIGMFSEGSDFTDDTILTVAVADALLNGGNYAQSFRDYFDLYPPGKYAYGRRFQIWASGMSSHGYGSYGNGSAMRVSPVIWVARDENEVIDLAKETAIVTHDHEEGVKGAQAIALSGFMALNGASKKDILDRIQSTFGYDIDGQVPNRDVFQVSCQETVPKAIKVFMDCYDFEQSMRKSVFMGRDTDTIACMVGTIMEPYLYGRFGIPFDLKNRVFEVLDQRLGDVVDDFISEFTKPRY